MKYLISGPPGYPSWFSEAPVTMTTHPLSDRKVITYMPFMEPLQLMAAWHSRENCVFRGKRLGGWKIWEQHELSPAAP